MRRLPTLILTLAGLLAMMLAGCTENPFPSEEPEYIVSFIIDRSSSYQDDLAGTAFEHFAQVKESLSRELAGRDALIVVSQINGGSEAVLFEGSPRAFGQRFPDKESFLKFLNSTPPGSSPVYHACAETIERLCRRHEQTPGLRSLLLIYSDMEDNHGGQDRLDAAARRLAKFPTAVGVYGGQESWADYFHKCGIRHAVAYDGKRHDPPLPEIP